MMKTKKNEMGDRNGSAAGTYRERRSDIAVLLRDIKLGLTKHEKAFQKTSRAKNWGYPGDLGHVKELLEEINGFLVGGDRK